MIGKESRGSRCMDGLDTDRKPLDLCRVCRKALVVDGDYSGPVSVVSSSDSGDLLCACLISVL